MSASTVITTGRRRVIVRLPPQGPPGPAGADGAQGPPGPPGGGSFTVDQFLTPANGQISFTLSTSPTDADSVVMEINGVDYLPGTDFSLSGQTITWLAPFAIDTTDQILIRYI